MQGARRLFVTCMLVLAGAGASTAAAQAPTPTEELPVYVDATPIERTVVWHWQRALAYALGDRDGWQAVEHRDGALAYLIEQRWIAGEAKDMGVKVTRRQVRKAYRRLVKRQFPRRRDLDRFYRRTTFTKQDIFFRLRGDLLAQRITAKVTEGAADVHDAQRRISDYRAARKAKWQPRTVCEASWRLADWCS